MDRTSPPPPADERRQRRRSTGNPSYLVLPPKTRS
jgi:hypothetical protein